MLITSPHTHTHTPRLTALCPGLPRWAGTRKVKPIWILLEQDTVNGSGISWAICKSTHRSRQTTMPAPHHSVFIRPDALPAAQPTASKHWRWTSPQNEKTDDSHYQAHNFNWFTCNTTCMFVSVTNSRHVFENNTFNARASDFSRSVGKCFSMAPHIRSHRAPCSCFRKKVSLQLSSEQSEGDVGIMQLDWKRVPQASYRGCKSSVAITASVRGTTQVRRIWLGLGLVLAFKGVH